MAGKARVGMACVVSGIAYWVDVINVLFRVYCENIVLFVISDDVESVLWKPLNREGYTITALPISGDPAKTGLCGFYCVMFNYTRIVRFVYKKYYTEVNLLKCENCLMNEL